VRRLLEIFEDGHHALQTLLAPIEARPCVRLAEFARVLTLMQGGGVDRCQPSALTCNSRSVCISLMSHASLPQTAMSILDADAAVATPPPDEGDM